MMTGNPAFKDPKPIGQRPNKVSSDFYDKSLQLLNEVETFKRKSEKVLKQHTRLINDFKLVADHIQEKKQSDKEGPRQIDIEKIQTEFWQTLRENAQVYETLLKTRRDLENAREKLNKTQISLNDVTNKFQKQSEDSADEKKALTEKLNQEHDQKVQALKQNFVREMKSKLEAKDTEFSRMQKKYEKQIDDMEEKFLHLRRTSKMKEQDSTRRLESDSQQDYKMYSLQSRIRQLEDALSIKDATIEKLKDHSERREEFRSQSNESIESEVDRGSTSLSFSNIVSTPSLRRTLKSSTPKRDSSNMEEASSNSPTRKKRVTFSLESNTSVEIDSSSPVVPYIRQSMTPKPAAEQQRIWQTYSSNLVMNDSETNDPFVPNFGLDDSSSNEDIVQNDLFGTDFFSPNNTPVRSLAKQVNSTNMSSDSMFNRLFDEPHQMPKQSPAEAIPPIQRLIFGRPNRTTGTNFFGRKSAN